MTLLNISNITQILIHMTTIKPRTLYNTRKWLNPPESPSTGSIVCYDGFCTDETGEFRSTFIELGSCHEKARLHRHYINDSADDFITKLETLRDEIDNFINHLKTT